MLGSSQKSEFVAFELDDLHGTIGTLTATGAAGSGLNEDRLASGRDWELAKSDFLRPVGFKAFGTWRAVEFHTDGQSLLNRGDLSRGERCRAQICSDSVRVDVAPDVGLLREKEEPSGKDAAEKHGSHVGMDLSPPRRGNYFCTSACAVQWVCFGD